MLSLGSDRAQELSNNGSQPNLHYWTCLTFIDGLLADIIERLPSSSKYTLLYITSPREFPGTDSVVYDSNEDAYQDPVHMEIKRDYSAYSSSSGSPAKSDRGHSLFDEYQYFTPGTYSSCVSVICSILTACQVSSWVSWLPSFVL